jgi:hypothetical protein
MPKSEQPGCPRFLRPAGRARHFPLAASPGLAHPPRVLAAVWLLVGQVSWPSSVPSLDPSSLRTCARWPWVAAFGFAWPQTINGLLTSSGQSIATRRLPGRTPKLVDPSISGLLRPSVASQHAVRQESIGVNGVDRRTIISAPSLPHPPEKTN